MEDFYALFGGAQPPRNIKDVINKTNGYIDDAKNRLVRIEKDLADYKQYLAEALGLSRKNGHINYDDEIDYAKYHISIEEREKEVTRKEIWAYKRVKGLLEQLED